MKLQVNFDLCVASSASGKQIVREIEPIQAERRTVFAQAEKLRA
jgi:hypothetical protein